VTSDRIILDLCGGTGAWSKPYVDAGYAVTIVDPAVDGGCDVRTFGYLDDYCVWGILCAPPCTHLSVSGARWWKSKGEGKLMEAISVVDACMRIVLVHKPAWWVLENPVGRLRRFLGPPRLIFDPCDYGDPYTKKTLLWGSFNVPEKSPVDPVDGSRMHLLGPSPERAALRSVTPEGFARAFFKANP